MGSTLVIKLSLALASSVIAIMSALNNLKAQTTPNCAEYLSGPLPSVSIVPNATLVPGQATPLSDLVTFNVPTNSQCAFVATTGRTIGTGSCSWGYIPIFFPRAPVVSGGYVYPSGPDQGYTAGLLYSPFHRVFHHACCGRNCRLTLPSEVNFPR
jgi:hypothetical protein